MDKLLPAIEEGNYALYVFLDYSSGFDTLSSSILIDKVDRHGIRGVSLDFISAYFSNRSQFVCFDSVESCTKIQDLGVIQGSKKGPLFFDIYSSYFVRMCSRDQSVLYADDTALVYVGISLNDFTDHINNRLRIKLDWCKCKKVSLNPTKSKFMVVTNLCLTLASLNIRSVSKNILKRFKWTYAI